MRYLVRIVAIVGIVLATALAMCSGEDRPLPWFDPSLECSEISAALATPVAEVWADGSPCAGESRTIRFRALDNGTAVACDPEVGSGAIWQNAKLAETRGDEAVGHCANLCRDPEAPSDATRCSAFCRDAADPSRCDPALAALAWRLPGAAELEALTLRVNDSPCTVRGCRMDTALEGDCDDTWAADLEDPEDPEHSERAFFDMRGGARGFDRVDLSHSVRCVADRL